MNRICSSAVACLGVALVLAPAAAARPAGERVTKTAAGDAGVGTYTFDSKDRPYYAASGGGAASASAAPKRVREISTTPSARTSATGYTCINNRSRKGFVAYAPQPLTRDKKAYYLRFQSNVYKQNGARRLKGAGAERYRTKQLINCVIGGAQGRGGNKLYRVVVSTAMFTPTDRIIGFKWGKGKEVSSAKASLGFSVPIKPVTISGSIDVHPTYTTTGSQGPDEQATSDFKPYVQNQINAIWEGSHTFRTQGSSHFQGNVGHGLWELPQTARTPPIKFTANHKRFCKYPFGVGCA